MNERQRTVLVDMDGVMADFDRGALVGVPKHLVVPRSQFYVARDYPSEMRWRIEAAYNAPGFFENLEPIPGLFGGWQAMIDAGYHPKVASSPLSSNKTAVEGKIQWLDRVMVPEFGASVVAEAIIHQNKWEYSGLALIDDRPDVPRGVDGRNDADWEHILFGWAHLKTVPLATAAFRLIDWSRTDELISTLDTISQLRSRKG